MNRSELQALGFRWTETAVITIHGRRVAVSPFTYLRGQEKYASTDRERKMLRLYRVVDEEGTHIGEVSELAIESAM